MNHFQQDKADNNNFTIALRLPFISASTINRIKLENIKN